MKKIALQLWRDRKFWRAVQLACLLAFVSLNLAACGLATWLTDANTILPVVLDSVLGILTIVAQLRGGSLTPAEADSITSFATSIQTALKSIQAIVDEYEQNSSPALLADITAAVKAVQDNLATFLPAVHVSDPATQATIENIFTLVAEQIAAWATVIPALTGTAKATVPAPAAAAKLSVVHDTFQLVTPLTKKAYKAAYNDLLARPTGSAEVDAALAKAKKL